MDHGTLPSPNRLCAARGNRRRGRETNQKPFDGPQPSLGGFRYAAWDADKTHDQEPDLILYGGQLIREGSGGDHHYLFANGDYRYVVWVNVLGKNSTPIGFLTVFRVDDRETDSLSVEREEVKVITLLGEPVVARYQPASNTDTTHYTTLGEVD